MNIGLTGSFASGKDTVARFLVQQGFWSISLSELIRDELRNDGLEITRDALIERGSSVRRQFGAGEWAKRALELAQKSGENNRLFISVRNPEEVNILAADPPFELWFVDAPAAMRWERARTRGRSDDFKSLDDMLEKERRENSDDPAGQQLSKVARMANRVIVNDKSQEDLKKTLEELLKEIRHHLD